MALSSFFSTFVIKLCLGVVLIVLHSYIFQKLSSKMELYDQSYDNPTSIAIVMSIFFIAISYIPQFKLPFFIIGASILPIVLIKEFYIIKWEKAIEMWIYWLMIWLLVAIILTAVLILIF